MCAIKQKVILNKTLLFWNKALVAKRKQKGDPNVQARESRENKSFMLQKSKSSHFIPTSKSLNLFGEGALEVKRKERVKNGLTSLQTRGTSKVHSRLTVPQVQECSWTQWKPEYIHNRYSCISYFMRRAQNWVSLWNVILGIPRCKQPISTKFTLDVLKLQDWMSWNLNECGRARPP